MGYDIAPEFRELIKVLPMDVLEVMKKTFGSHQRRQGDFVGYRRTSAGD